MDDAPSLRDALEKSYDAVIAPTEQVVTDATQAEVAQTVVEKTETAPDKARDEQGRFATKPAEKAPEKAAPVVADKPEKLGVKRPDSWKKELWPIWDKLDAGEALSKDERKQFLEYLPQREGEYQKGVSTYKSEWDRAKPLIDAVAPFDPFLRQHNMKPEQFVAALAQSDQTLRFGTKDQKLQTFNRLIKDYDIPIHELLVQGEDGKVYFNNQYAQAQAQQPQNLTPQDVDQMVAKKFQDQMWLTAIQEFKDAKDDGGNTLNPHIQDQSFVATMDGLLRSGAVKGGTPKEAIKLAYDTTLRLPQYAHFYEAQQTAKRTAEDESKRKEEAEKAARAKREAVSVRGSTPTASTGPDGKKPLRAALESAYDQHIGANRI